MSALTSKRIIYKHGNLGCPWGIEMFFNTSNYFSSRIWKNTDTEYCISMRYIYTHIYANSSQERTHTKKLAALAHLWNFWAASGGRSLAGFSVMHWVIIAAATWSVCLSLASAAVVGRGWVRTESVLSWQPVISILGILSDFCSSKRAVIFNYLC